MFSKKIHFSIIHYLFAIQFLLIGFHLKAQVNAGPDQEGCSANFTLAGSNPGVNTGLWTVIYGSVSINNPTLYNTTIIAGLGEHTLRWTVGGESDDVVITNNQVVANAGPDRTICENYVTLVGNDPALGTGLWTIGNTNVIIANPTSNVTNVTNLSQGSNIFTWTVSNGTCTARDYVTITSNSIHVNAGVSTQACSDTLILTGTQPPAGTSGLWTTVEGGGTFDNPTSYSTIARNLMGYNRLRWTITSGTCSYFDEMEYINLLPTKAITMADNRVCDTFTQIVANGPDTGEHGLWTMVAGSSGVTITTPSAYETLVSNLDQGVNIFRWTISNSSCSTSDLLTITNNKVIANAGPDRTICDTAYSLNANVTTGTGYWTANTIGVVIENSTLSNTNVSALNFGHNSFSWTIVYDICDDTDVVILTSNKPRNVSAGSDQNICSGFANLAGSNPGIGTGLWEIIGGAGNIATPTANQTSVNNLATGANILRWTVTVGSCSVSDQAIINNNSLYVNAGTNATVCNMATFKLNGNPPVAPVTGLWTVNGGSGTFDNASVYNTVIRNMAKGINTYVWTLSNLTGCSNSAQVIIINDTPDSAKVEADRSICTDYTTIHAIPVSNGIGSWNVQSGSATIVTPASNNTLVTGIISGRNVFRWTVDKNGCQLYDDIEVTNSSVIADIPIDTVKICTPTHTTTLIGNTLKTSERGLWTNISGGSAVIISPSSNITTVTNIDYGTTIFRWTVSNASGSCSDYDDVWVIDNYYSLTTANFAGSSPLCVDHVQVLGSMWPAGASGLWTSTAPDVTFDNPSSVATTVRNLPQGISTITWTITKDGCPSPASFNVVNNGINSSAGNNDTICKSTTNLNALALLTGQTGVWTVDNLSVNIADINSPTTLVSNLITGNNTFTWVVTDTISNCSATTQVVIANNAFSVTAGNNTIACDSRYTLRGSDPLSGTGLWTINSGTGRFANATSYQTLVSGMSNGPNTFTWTVKRNGCEASDDVQITNDLYQAVLGSDQSLCINSTTVTAQPINPTSGATGLWSVLTGGGTIAYPTNYSTLVTSLGLGDNRLKWTVTSSNGCVSSDEIIISYKGLNISAGTNETTCDNYSILNATPLNANEVGQWSSSNLGVSFGTPNIPITSVNGLDTGLNTFAWYVRDTITACEATSTVQITSNYFTPYAGPTPVLINVNNYTMMAWDHPAGSSGVWSIISGAGTFANITSPTTLVTNLGYGNNSFRWTVTWSNCTYSSEVSIAYSYVLADAGGDTFICSPTYTLTGNNPDPYGTGVWTKISGTGIITNSASPVTTVTNIQMGSVNIYRWTITCNGYSVFDDVTITNNLVTANAGADAEISNMSTYTLSGNQPNAGSGVWTCSSDNVVIDNPSLYNATASNIPEGNTTFTWNITHANCFDADAMIITRTVTSIEDLTAKGIKIYPNPTKGQLYIEFTNIKGFDEILVFRLNGQLLIKKKITDKTEHLDLSSYEDNAYFIVIQGNNELVRTKIIVQD